MRERRGAFGRASELADSVMAGVKRRQAARAPKVLLYDEAGRPRMLDASSAHGSKLVETARSMVELAVPEETAVDLPEDE